MQDKSEITEINDFLSLTGPAIIAQVKMILQSAGLKVKETGRGPDLTFTLKSGHKNVEFCPQNLLMDIAAVDRNEEPLRFDRDLRDFDYFLTKKARVMEGRLKVVFQFLTEDNLDVAVDNINRNMKKDERIRIWRFNRNESGHS